MKIPSFSELERAEKGNSRSKTMIFVFALITVLAPILVGVIRYLVKLSISERVLRGGSDIQDRHIMAKWNVYRSFT